MKRIFSIVSALAIILSLPACGAPAPSEPESPSRDNTSSAAAPAASAEQAESKGKVTLKFFTGKIETIDIMNEIINDFNASQNRITVEQEYQRDASNIIKIKFASGEVPDIMTTYEQEFVDQDKYLDLSNEDEWWSRLSPAMRDSCTDIKTGSQFRICTNMTMAGYFYNKEIFDELGLSPAAEWSEFTSNLQTIKDQKDITPWFIFGREAWHLGHLIEFLPHGYVKQSLGALPAKKAMLDNDKANLNFGALDGPMGMFAANLIALKNNGLINGDVLSATSDNCTQDFVTGKAAMFSNGMWALGGLLDAAPDMADKIGFAPYPAYMPGSRPVVLSAEDSGYSISASTPNADEAKEFLSFLFNPRTKKSTANH